MSAAAVIPIQTFAPEWYKVELADEKRFGRGSLCRLVTVLKYKARLFGPSFETDYAELMTWTGYKRSAIASGLSALSSEKHQFAVIQSSGRGVRIKLVGVEKTKVGLQKSEVRTSPIDGNARARQASKPEEEKNVQRSEKAPSTPKPEESGQHRPRQKPVVDPAIDHADKANPVQAAKKIGLYKPERFSIPALRTALWHFRRRQARINAGGLLYVILMSIPRALSKPEMKPGNDYAALVEQVREKAPPPEQTSLFQAVESLSGGEKAGSVEEEQQAFERFRRQKELFARQCRELGLDKTP